MLLLSLFVQTADAKDEITFAPDRPGLGDSTATPGRGRAIFEVGAVGAFEPGEASQVSSAGPVARLGVDEGVEIRLRLPDLGVGDGSLQVGTVGVGAKFGGALSERWSSSLVPEVTLDPRQGTFGASLGGTVALGLGQTGLWCHGNAAGNAGEITSLAGVGVSWSPGPAGAYLNVGHNFGGSTFAGGGAWWLVSDLVQLDASLDIDVLGESTTLIPGLGLALGL